MSRTLALDIGNRRIGIAVSDATKMIARPLCIVDRKTVDAIATLVALVHEHAVDEVVVGYPINTNGTVGAQAAAVAQFVDGLRAAVHVPVILVDERFSSQEAAEIRATHKRHHKPKRAAGADADADDDVAAAVILQRYLDERRSVLANWGIDEEEDEL
jgi:putative Holliday junction resolvase